MSPPIDICDVCKHSAYVNEGKTEFVKVDDPTFPLPYEWRFTCRACLRSTQTASGSAAARVTLFVPRAK